LTGQVQPVSDQSKSDNPFPRCCENFLYGVEQDLGEHLADLPGDVLICAEEDAEQVTAAHDPDQVAAEAAPAGVDHRQPLEVAAVH
jgi:hypothetical protein